MIAFQSKFAKVIDKYQWPAFYRTSCY